MRSLDSRDAQRKPTRTLLGIGAKNWQRRIAKRLLLEGGGGINGAFLAARLIDEVSLLLMPVADGAEGTPTLFDRIGGSVRMLKLRSVTRLEEGILHLRYQVT